MDYRWNEDKDVWLRAERGISFDQLIGAIEGGGLLSDREHHQAGRREHQRVAWVFCQGSIWVVPYVMENENVRFLKTAYRSRKAARQFQGGAGEEA